MKNAVFWDVVPCRSAQAGSSLADYSTLNMEAISSSETSVHRRSTRHQIPEDGILQLFSVFLEQLMAISRLRISIGFIRLFITVIKKARY
jgi:hypothetical protein